MSLRGSAATKVEDPAEGGATSSYPGDYFASALTASRLAMTWLLNKHRRPNEDDGVSRYHLNSLNSQTQRTRRSLRFVQRALVLAITSLCCNGHSRDGLIADGVLRHVYQATSAVISRGDFHHASPSLSGFEPRTAPSNIIVYYTKRGMESQARRLINRRITGIYRLGKLLGMQPSYNDSGNIGGDRVISFPVKKNTFGAHMDTSKFKLTEFLANRRSKIVLILAAYVIALIVMVVLIYNRWSAGDIAVAVVMFPLGLSVFLAPVFGKLWGVFPEDG